MRHEGKSQTEATARALEMLEVVRIPSAKRRLDAYPHEMCGGMRQRAMIALALACKPKILLADEPTTALDATVQIQILLLLRELQREFGMSVIFVTHDIGVAIEICDRVAVMYAGQIVEQGTLAPDRALADPSLCAGAVGFDRPRRQTRPAAGNHPGDAAVARPGADQLLVRAALRLCGSRVASSGCRPMCDWGGASREVHFGGADRAALPAICRQRRLPAEPGIGPASRSRKAADNLLGLMRIERAGAGGPALRQNLHREQFRVDLRS